MDNWIGELDEELLGDATDLRFIDLRNNALAALPERFLKAASRLEHVHLGSNFLKVFDASLFSASTLSLIDVSDNQVTIRLLVCASLPKVSVPWWMRAAPVESPAFVTLVEIPPCTPSTRSGRRFQP
jgi:hypothetical protein